MAMALAMMLGIFAPQMAYANDIGVTIDGVAVVFPDARPQIVDGRTLVPVRAVFEAVGFDVDWDADTRTATLARGGDTVIITIGDAVFTTNGQSHTLDVPAQIIGGSTMLPIRAVLESVGYFVGWDAAASLVLVSTEPLPETAQTPQTPPDASRVRVAVGDSHSMAIHADGSLWTWGDNSFGQLGNGRFTRYQEGAIINQVAVNNDEHSPIRIMEDVVEIAAGVGFSMAVTANGDLYTWGVNDRGQLGNGTTTNVHTPQRIMQNVAQIDTGIALTTDGRLYQLSGSEQENAPSLVASNVRSAAAGHGHIVWVTHDNRLYGVGMVQYLGFYDGNPNLSPIWGWQARPDRGPVTDEPVHILSDIQDVVTGWQTTHVLTTSGRMYGWGLGDIGDGVNAFHTTLPRFVTSDATTIFPGSMLLTSDNSLLRWGTFGGSFAFRTDRDGHTIDAGGQTMDGLNIPRHGVPTHVMDNVLVAAGSRHILIVDRDLNLWAFGNNQFGQLGTGVANVYEIRTENDGEWDWHVPVYVENNNADSPVLVGSVR